MNASIPPRLQTLLRYFFAYLLFALFGLLGVVVMVNLHSVIVTTGTLISGRYGMTTFLNTWVFFILLGVFTVSIVVMEHSLNKAARTGEVLKRGVRIFAVEGALALLTVVAPVVTKWLLGVR